MADNVIPLFAKLDTVEETISSALNASYDQVLIMGFDKDGMLRYRSNFPDMRMEIAAIEIVKHHILTTEMLGL